MKNKTILSLSRLKIKNSLGILFVVLFFIPFILLSVFFIVYLYNSLYKFEHEKVSGSLQQTELSFNKTLNTVMNFSDRLYVNRQINNVLTTEYNNIQDVYEAYAGLKFLEDYLNTYTEVVSFRYYVNNDTLLDNQFIIKASEQVLDSGWYKRALEAKGQRNWIYFYDNFTKKYYLSLIRSVWTNDNQILAGVQVININPDYIQLILDKSLYTTFIILENKVIYTSQEEISYSQNELVKFYYMNNFDGKIIKNISLIGEEKNAIYAVKFTPEKARDLDFTILYLIPTKQILKATNTTIIVSVICLLTLFMLGIFFLIIFSKYLDSRTSKIKQQVDNLVVKDFEIASSIGGNDEFAELYNTIYKMSCEVNELVQVVYQKNLEKEQLALKQSEISFKMLANQINPHFLFNTIETIRMKALSTGSDKDVARMLKLLAFLLRYNLSVKGQPVLLTQEIDAVQNYLTIQHMRFGDRISYDVQINSDIQNVSILPLLIQPLVENSFNHGLEDKVSGGTIYVMINTEVSEDNYIISIKVADNGKGINEEDLLQMNRKLSNNYSEDTSHIGIYNVNSRIKLFYGIESGVSVESKEGEYTIVTITIIQKQSNKIDSNEEKI